MRTALPLVFLLITAAVARAQLPPPPDHWADWDTSWHDDDPGELAADALLDAPAGHRGGVVVKGGHFYSGDHRVRFWGVNLAFAANFPAHDMADRLARRLSRYGINAVRLHHMDAMPFPAGIFADAGLERLSPEALDRLDYFVAALKARGVYVDLNLHVSRNYSHYHRSPNGHDGPRVDKMVDLFDPELIAAQRRYAADLLGHVNAYTHARYADEPSVGLVEINNENSLFMWGAEAKLAALPEPYAAELNRQWNGWLSKRYATRAKLSTAWATAVEPAGPNLLRDPNQPASWTCEQHGDARAAVSAGDRGVRVTVAKADGVGWLVQLTQRPLAVAGGRWYTVTFAARADRPVTVGVGVGQAHDPWQGLGPGKTFHVGTEWKPCAYRFAATADDADARLSFSLGTAAATVDLADVDLHAGGGPPGLGTGEDLGTVRSHSDDDAAARRDDWVRFLADAEAAYYDGMRDYLHHDLGVRCPVTGTIGFGPMGTSVQARQDFVDAHAYWQHPTFPGKAWDPAHWTMPNTPMVDDPAHATLWSLAATRVAGLPFTVTEYQHPAPNDWAAECIPEIATFAALQHWDGVFLFAYSHDGHYDKGRIASFFDIEGNPTKMPLVPMGARLFLGGVVPSLPNGTEHPIDLGVEISAVSETGNDLDRFLRKVDEWDPLTSLDSPQTIRFVSRGSGTEPHRTFTPETGVWSTLSSSGPGRGDFTCHSQSAAVWTGFLRHYRHQEFMQVGSVRIATDNTFATVVVLSASPAKPLENADRLLVTAVARARNTDMGWNAARTSVGAHWGHAPVQVEVVHADVGVPGRWAHAWALDPAGRRTAVDVAEPRGDDTVLHLGKTAALAYVVER